MYKKNSAIKLSKYLNELMVGMESAEKNVEKKNQIYKKRMK